MDKVDKNKLNLGSQKASGNVQKTISNVGIMPYSNNTSTQNNFQPNSYDYIDSEAKIADLDAQLESPQENNGEEEVRAMDLMEYDFDSGSKSEDDHFAVQEIVQEVDIIQEEEVAQEKSNNQEDPQNSIASKELTSSSHEDPQLPPSEDENIAQNLDSAQGDVDFDDDSAMRNAVSNTDEDSYLGNPGDEDDEERFIKKDEINSELEAINKKIVGQIMANLEEYKQEVKGIRPNTNKNRSLSHEQGGLEVKKHDGKSEEDVWDDRSEEVTDMGEDAYEHMTDASTSTIRQSFVHRQKQDKKRKKRKNGASNPEPQGGLSISEARRDSKSSHADKVNSDRSGSKGGGGIFGGIGF